MIPALLITRLIRPVCEWLFLCICRQAEAYGHKIELAHALHEMSELVEAYAPVRGSIVHLLIDFYNHAFL